MLGGAGVDEVASEARFNRRPVARGGGTNVCNEATGVISPIVGTNVGASGLSAV